MAGEMFVKYNNNYSIKDNLIFNKDYKVIGYSTPFYLIENENREVCFYRDTKFVFSKIIDNKHFSEKTKKYIITIINRLKASKKHFLYIEKEIIKKIIIELSNILIDLDNRIINAIGINELIKEDILKHIAHQNEWINELADIIVRFKLDMDYHLQSKIIMTTNDTTKHMKCFFNPSQTFELDRRSEQLKYLYQHRFRVPVNFISLPKETDKLRILLGLERIINTGESIIIGIENTKKEYEEYNGEIAKKCPKCGNMHTVKVFYGLPTKDADELQRMQLIYNYGCCVPNFPPKKYCYCCGTLFEENNIDLYESLQKLTFILFDKDKVTLKFVYEFKDDTVKVSEFFSDELPFKTNEYYSQIFKKKLMELEIEHWDNKYNEDTTDMKWNLELIFKGYETINITGNQKPPYWDELNKLLKDYSQ